MRLTKEREEIIRQAFMFQSTGLAATIMELIDEIDALREEVRKAEGECKLGVGNGAGNLFVHGDYESVRAAQILVLERHSLRAENARLQTLVDVAVELMESRLCTRAVRCTPENPFKCERCEALARIEEMREGKNA
jgi:hypothetical protein